MSRELRSSPATHKERPSTAIESAFRLLRRHGLGRQIPLVVGVLATGLLDGIGIAALFPVLTFITDTGDQPSKLHLATLHVLSLFGLRPSLELLCGIILVALLLKAVLQFVFLRKVGKMSALVAQELRQDLLDALIQARWSYFTINPVGRFASAITSEANAASQIYRVALQVMAQTIRTLVVAGLALLLGWELGALSITLGILMGLALTSLNHLARRAGDQRQKANRGLVEELNDVLTGFKPLKVMNRQQSLISELIDETKELRRAISRLIVNEQLSLGLPDVLSAYLLAIAAFIAVAILGSPVDSFVIGGVVTFALMNNVGKLQKVTNQIAQTESMYWALNSLITDTKKEKENFQGRARPTLAKNIRLSKIHFNYGRGVILRAIDLEIEAKRITALTGPSGAGKSTIADLILGFYQPLSGKIAIDGIDLADVDMSSWRSRVGFVPQEILLFNDTIRANITLGEPGIEDRDIWAALDLSGASQFVRNLPGALDAMVGERGQALSGGERQRIALARALAHKPSLLILDEATSALDPETEEAICRSLQTIPGLTILAITHQQAWIDSASRVYRIHRGQCELVSTHLLTEE